METRVVLWTVALCTLIIYWFLSNSKLEIDYERHTQLIDRVTGAKRNPSDFLDLDKIIHHKPQYINSTNAIERLYDLAYLSTFENPFVIDQSYSNKKHSLLSSWPVANKTRCKSELEWILQQLAQHGNYSSLRGQLGYELTNFMDSFGRPEAALFSGSIHWMGSYKNCLRAKLDGGRIKTRYCISRMRFKSWPKDENIYPSTRIRIGICLPEACETLSYGSLKSQINQLAMFDLPDKLKDDLDMDSLFCLPDERSPIRKIPLGGRILIIIVGVWLAIVLFATVVYESIIRRNKGSQYKEAFFGLKSYKPPQEATTAAEKQVSSAYEPHHKLAPGLLEQIICGLSVRCSIKAFKINTFRVKQDQRVRLNLGCLDFFKVCMTLSVVGAHAGYLGSTHMRSMGNRIEVSTGESGMLLMTVGRCVDTFFLFFGILTSYNLLKKFTEQQLGNPLVWLAVNVGIFVRIAPMFMFVFWYSKFIAPYTSSGPWWDYGIDSTTVKGYCINEPWWKSIPYLGASGKPSVPACNLPSWFIVSYSQLSLLMPLITYLFCKLPGRAAKCALISVLLAASAGSIAVRLALQTTVREEGITLYGAFLTDLLEKFESTGHLTTLSRLGAVGLGCLVGYLLRRYEERQISSLPRWLTSPLANWCSILGLIVMLVLPVIGHRIYLLTGRMATWTEFVGTNVLMIILWPILVSVIVISCTTKYNHIVFVRFLSHSFWHVFNRLGLCIFLIHWEILYMVVTGFEQAPSHGFIFDIVKFWSFGVLFSILLGLVIHILIEAPLSNLLMIIYRHLSSSGQLVELPSAAMKHLEAQQAQQQQRH